MRHFLILIVLVSIVFSQSLPPGLKLRVLHVLPGETLLTGRQAITVVYSRAVIALGSDYGKNVSSQGPISLSCNVPGLYRWVTTSIFRFDPSIDWPTDLKCKLTLKVVRSFDGLQLENSKTVQYVTEPLVMSLSTIRSNQTLALNEQWGMSSTHPEVPPDGEIFLDFNSPVTIGILNIFVVQNQKRTKTRVTKCDGNDRCAKIQLTNPLEQNQKYQLLLAQGSKVSQYSGSTPKPLSIDIFGLLDFKFYFARLDSVRYTKWTLGLIHGLSNSTNVALLSRAIVLNPNTSFKLTRPTLGTIELEGKFKGNTKYTITVSPSNSIRDGYNLPLKGSTVSFTTGNYTEFFAIPEFPVVSMDQVPASWEIVHRGLPNVAYKIGNINASNIDECMRLLASNPSSTPSFLKASLKESRDNTIHLRHVKSATYLEESGLFLQEKIIRYPNGQYSQFYLVNDVQLVVHFVSTDHGKLIVWIARLDSTSDVANVKVALYRGAEKIYTGTTNRDGIIQFENVNSEYGQLRAVISFEDHLMIMEGVSVMWGEQETNYQKCFMFTDRRLYNVGDRVHFKGYIREFNMKTKSQVALSSTQDLLMSFNGMQDQKVPLDVTYGSFDSSLVIPENVTSGSNYLSLRLGDNYICSHDFVVADPRVPSIEMDLSANSTIARLDQGTTIEMSLSTYTGSPVQRTSMNLTWRVVKPMPCPLYHFEFARSSRFMPCPREDVEIERGSRMIETNETGGASHLIKMTQTDKIEFGNVLEISLSYFAPSRETLERKLRLTVAPSELKLSLTTSSGIILPGFDFRVGSQLHDSSGLPVDNRDIIVSLYEWESSEPPASDLINPAIGAQNRLQSCRIKSSRNTLFKCSFTLPKIAKYILVAESKDKKGTSVYSNMLVGKNVTEWQNEPLKKSLGIQFTLDREEYVVGDTAYVEFSSPWTSAYAMVVFDSPDGTTTKKLKLDVGPHRIPIHVRKPCTEGCRVSLVMYTPQGAGLKFKKGLEIPTSVLFDPTQAQTVEASLKIVTKDPKVLSVEIKAESSILTPGSSSTINIKVKDERSQSVESEVCLWIVDKAMLDLLPNEIPTKDYFTLPTPNNFVTSSSLNTFVTSKVYNEIYEIFKRRVLRDPYIYLDWPLLNDWNVDFDKSDAEYFKQWNSLLTERMQFDVIMPMMESTKGAFAGGMTRKSARSGVASFDMAASPPSAADSTSPVRKNFMQTPVFLAKIIVPATGASIPFTLPDNVGSFVINAVAMTRETQGGYSNTTIIARKSLNMFPSLPKSVRISDAFSGGVTLNLIDASDRGSYRVVVTVSNPEFLSVRESTLVVRLEDSTPVEVLFEFTAKKLGDVSLTFKVVGSVTDALETKLSVLHMQETVVVASSFAVSERSDRKEGFAIPEASGPVQLNISTGVGRLPSILSLAETLSDVEDAPWCFPSSEFTKTFPFGVYTSFYPDRFSRRVTESALERAEVLFKKGVDRLVHCTNEAGLHYGNVETQYNIEPHLNSMGLFTQKHLKDMNLEIPDETVQKWKRNLLQYVERTTPHTDLSLYVFTHYVLDGEWNPTTRNHTIMYLSQQWQSLPTMSQITLASVLYDKNTNDPLINTIIARTMDNFRVQGRTAYPSEKGGARQHPMMTSFLLMELLAKKQYDSPLIEKFTNYLSSYVTDDAGLNILALAIYDRWKENTKPNLELTTLMDSIQLTKETIQTSDYLVNKALDLNTSNKTIRFLAKGTGEASISLAVTFEPKKQSNRGEYRGISVQKVFKRVDSVTNIPYGPPITSASPGSAVAVIIELTTPDDLSAVRIVDSLPGALEPVDPNLKDQPPIEAKWGFPTFFGQYKRSQVIFMTQSLSSGTHQIQYNAFVVSQGTFIVPSTKAYVISQPELMGLSESFSFVSNP